MTADFFDQLEDQLRAAVVRGVAPAPSGWLRLTRRRRLTLLTTAISLPSAAVVVALALVGVLGSDGAHPTPASAAQLLTQAANVAGRQPAEPPLAAGEYHYSRDLENDVVEFGGGHYARVTVAVERWVSHDGHLRLQAMPVGAPSFLSAADRRAWQRAGRPALGRRQASLLRRELSVHRRGHPFHVGPRLLSFTELHALPTAPTKLRAVLAHYAREYHASRALAASNEFVFATQIIRGTPASPALRAASFRVLASLPGVRAEGTLRDHAGRSGTAVSIRWADLRRVLIFDPASAQLLEERFITLPPSASWTPSYPKLAAGTTIGFITQQATGVVDGPTQRP